MSAVISTITPSIIEFKGAEDISLSAQAWGDPSHPPVLLAHGGGQTRYAWRNTAKELANKGWYAIAYDLRGHGDSDWSPTGSYALPIFGEDLMLIAESLEQKPVIVGASLGGFSALFAGEYREDSVFRAVVFVDITPKLDPEGVGKIKGFMTDNSENGFESLEAAADAIAAYLPDRPRPKSLDGLSKNLRERDGRFYWHWDPNFMKGKEGPRTTLQENEMREMARAITEPVLLIRGKTSDLVTMEAVEQFMEDVPHAKFVDVQKAGHMIAGDRNDVFNEAVIEFLDSLD